MLNKYIQFNNSENYNLLEDATRSKISTAAFGVLEPLRYSLIPKLFSKALIISRDSLSAKRASEEITNFCGEKAVFLPAKDDVLLYRKAYEKTNYYKRITAVYDIICGAKYICASPEALLQLCPKNIAAVTINVAGEFPLDKLLFKLIEMGYARKEFIEVKGDFSLRGDILEIFPINDENAYRVDFFGDEIEKIRVYDISDKKPTDEIRAFTFISAIDFSISDKEEETLCHELRKSLNMFGTLMVRNKAKQLIDELSETLLTNKSDTSLSFIMPLLSSNAPKGIFSIIDNEYSVVFDETKLVLDNLDFLIKEQSERLFSLSNGGKAFDFSIKQYYDRDILLKEIYKFGTLFFQTVSVAMDSFRALKTFRFNCSPVPRYTLKANDLPRDVENWKRAGYKVIICAGNAERAKRLHDRLDGEKVFTTLSDNAVGVGAFIVTEYVQNGFVLHDNKLVVIGTCDLYLAVKEKKIIKRRNETFSAPEVGDFAVHERFGIGIVRGTERISTTEGTKDYVKLEYFGGDFLYVPTEQLDRLTKYIGSENSPRLNKIGGLEFDRIKQKVRESIAKMTINLKKLYHDRAEQKGFVFSRDNEISAEFDDAFEFNETDDQIQSILEIKKDMESPKVMDRLLCGDVGYGKTEVALRAAFKAILDGKQVAMVAPTTILTEQHFDTCVKRFKNFGVRLGLLNRFCTPKKIKETIEKVKNGEIDFVIGTHRLFGKDVLFKDLGLLILDEEQCFGVEHKEKLRTLKNNVDTLTMTATPIPRTLHMSLSGIRDISLINTPPETRIPVQAYVVEESEEIIADATRRELARGGQVFILYNRVDSIYQFASNVLKIVPEAKMVVGHGQMKREELEDNITSFYKNEKNLLICTTIIENGIDLPNANTLIVIDADKLGLFTLYQLKGRVGRSDKMAHAYFTYKPDKVLGETAYKRLSALIEYSDLGSGYKIAMRDLEIRGAGNVLGREQHGHMADIGYELYAKLLREQLGEVTKDYETELDIRLDAYIPNTYIDASTERMDTYKAISELKSENEANDIIEKLSNNYGQIPKETLNLVKIALFKNYARSAEIIKAVISKEKCYLEYKDLNSLNNGALLALKEYGDRAVLYFEENPIIRFTLNMENENKLIELTNFVCFSPKI